MSDRWFKWEWLPANLRLLCMAIFTDGSAVLAPGAVATGGWGFVVLAAGIDHDGKVHFGWAGRISSIFEVWATPAASEGTTVFERGAWLALPELCGEGGSPPSNQAGVVTTIRLIRK